MKDDKDKKKVFAGRTVLVLGIAAMLMIAISGFSEANIMNIMNRHGQTQWYINDTAENQTFIGIGTSFPTATLDVNGTIKANGSFVCTSANGLCSSPSGAPNDASYVTLSLSSGLTNERVLSVGAGIVAEDFGANGNIRINVTAVKCSVGEYSSWNGTHFLCFNATSSSGDIEGVIAGTGLTGGGTSGTVTLNANTTFLQVRVNDSCASGSSIRVINSDGSVVCETDSTGTDYYVTSISVNGTTVKNITLTRNGLSELSALFTDLDTYAPVAASIYTNITNAQNAIVGLQVGASATNTSLSSINSTAQSALTTANSAVTVNNAQYTNITAAQGAIVGLQAGASATNTSIDSLNTTKAGTGTGTCGAGFVVQNITTSTGGVSVQCVLDQSGSGSFVYNDYFNQFVNTSSNVQFNTVKAHTSAGLIINASNGVPVVDFGSGNTNNTNFFGSVSIPTGQNLCLGGDCRSVWPTGGGGSGLLFAGTPQNGYVAPTFNSTHLNGTVRTLFIDDSGATFTGGFGLRTALDRQTNLLGVDYGGGPNRIDYMLANSSVSVLWGSQTDPSYKLNDFKIDATTVTLSANVTVSSSNSLCVGGRCLSNKVYTPNDYLTNNNTRYVNTNLTLTLPASSNVLVRCELYQDSAAATTGQQLMVNTTGSPTTVRTTYTSMSSASAMESFSGTSTSSNAFADLGSSTNNHIAQLRSMIVTSGSPSVFTIELRSEISGSETRLRRGSNCEYETY